MDGRSELLGHRVAVTAVSQFSSRFVPLQEMSLFSLYPDVCRRSDSYQVKYRLANINLVATEDGKLIGRSPKWWDTECLADEDKHYGKEFSRIRDIFYSLNKELDSECVCPLGHDLPVFVDANSSVTREMDWDALEQDVYCGLNSSIPFTYCLSDKTKYKITDELPFIDFPEHFRSVVTTSTLMSLIRQLLAQYTINVRGMSLVPVRWLSKLTPSDTIIVDTGVYYAMNFISASAMSVDSGALHVSIKNPYSAGAGF